MDELSQFLAERYPLNYITGVEDCNLLLWGIGGTTPKMFTLNIGIEYNPNTGKKEDMEIKDVLNIKYKEDISFQRLVKYGRLVADMSKIPFIVLVYPALRKDYNNRWENTEVVYPREHVYFHWYEMGKNKPHKLLEGDALKKAIYEKLEVSPNDRGTCKSKNSHLSDYFHFWSRESLSKKITKLDIDGIIINDSANKGILIEIKRSSIPPIPQWRPQYDKANYSLECNYAKRINSCFWLLHHEKRECDDTEIISFFDIEDVRKEEKKDFIISNEVVLEMNISGKDSLLSRIDKFICS